MVVLCFSVAPHTDHTGDRRLPSEKAGRCERSLHPAADAGLPGEGDKEPQRSKHCEDKNSFVQNLG